MNESRNSESTPVIYPASYMLADCKEDEVDLIELWVKLGRYKPVFVKVFLPLFLLGVLYTLFLFQEKYSLTTSIQIGSLFDDGKVTLLEAPESLLAKVKNAIAPAFSREWMARNEYEKPFDTSIENPKKSSIILIKNKVKDNDIELFKDYQNGVASRVVQDHHRLMQSLLAPLSAKLEISKLKLKELENPLSLQLLLKPLEIQLESARIKKKKLEDEAFFGIKKAEFSNRITAAEHEKDQLEQKSKVLGDQLKRLDGTKQLLEKYIDRLQRQLADAAETRLSAAKDATPESAMSQLLIGNEIQQNQQRLLSLEERYNVEIPNKRSALLKEIEANNLAIADKQKAIDVLKQKYNEMLLDNKIQIEQLGVELDRLQLEIDKAKMQHNKSIEEQQQRVKELEKQLKNYDETRVVGEAVESLKPVGLSRSILLVLVVFLAGFAGFVAMLIALFRDRVRERLLEQQ